MIDEKTMRTAMQAYIDNFNKRDLQALVNLYTDDATVDDPVGNDTRTGRWQIEAFYAESLKTGATLTLSAPIRTSHANSAAMAFTVELELPEGRFRIHVIDVMTFANDGRFASMHAYWGPGDMQPLT